MTHVYGCIRKGTARANFIITEPAHITTTLLSDPNEGHFLSSKQKELKYLTLFLPLTSPVTRWNTTLTRATLCA